MSQSEVSQELRDVLALPKKWREIARDMAQRHGVADDMVCALRACANELDNVARRLAGEGWMPIETAPKDGRYILLGYAGSHSEEGRWMADASLNHWGETGWFGVGDDVLCEHPSHPTHWREMPAPPATTENGNG